VDAKLKRHILKVVGATIRKRRLELGITQKQLATQCGIAETFMSDIEHGERSPTFLSVMEMALALGETPEGFFKILAEELGPINCQEQEQQG